MGLTNKFLLYDTKIGGFVQADGTVFEGTNMVMGILYSEQSAKDAGLDVEDTRFLQIPVTKEFVDNLPFDLLDTDPMMEHTSNSNIEQEEALKGDFILLTEEGFFKEKYNSITLTSSPKVSGYHLDYATLYNMESLQRTGTESIIEPSEYAQAPIVIPVGPKQQENLKELDVFRKDPYGFFFEPVGENNSKLEEDLEAGLESIKPEDGSEINQ